MRDVIPIIRDEDVKRFAELSAIYNKNTAIKKMIELEKKLEEFYSKETVELNEALERVYKIGFQVGSVQLTPHGPILIERIPKVINEG